jgi:hypothetical protein
LLLQRLGAKSTHPPASHGFIFEHIADRNESNKRYGWMKSLIPTVSTIFPCNCHKNQIFFPDSKDITEWWENIQNEIRGMTASPGCVHPHPNRELMLFKYGRYHQDKPQMPKSKPWSVIGWRVPNGHKGREKNKVFFAAERNGYPLSLTGVPRNSGTLECGVGNLQFRPCLYLHAPLYNKS